MPVPGYLSIHHVACLHLKVKGDIIAIPGTNSGKTGDATPQKCVFNQSSPILTVVREWKASWVKARCRRYRSYPLFLYIWPIGAWSTMSRRPPEDDERQRIYGGRIRIIVNKGLTLKRKKDFRGETYTLIGSLTEARRLARWQGFQDYKTYSVEPRNLEFIRHHGDLRRTGYCITMKQCMTARRGSIPLYMSYWLGNWSHPSR